MNPFLISGVAVCRLGDCITTKPNESARKLKSTKYDWKHVIRNRKQDNSWLIVAAANQLSAVCQLTAGTSPSQAERGNCRMISSIQRHSV